MAMDAASSSLDHLKAWLAADGYGGDFFFLAAAGGSPTSRPSSPIKCLNKTSEWVLLFGSSPQCTALVDFEDNGFDFAGTQPATTPPIKRSNIAESPFGTSSQASGGLALCHIVCSKNYVRDFCYRDRFFFVSLCPYSLEWLVATSCTSSTTESLKLG
jgi:hypothetical protein